MKYLASCSFGKDSIATVLLALMHGEPLDGVIFSEVMFDIQRNISGEIPEHIEWIYNTAIPKLASLGVETTVVRSERDYMWYFTDGIVTKGKRTGMLHGFPIGGMCVINRDCKVRPIKAYLRNIGDDVTQYIGIAVDEPKRLARLKPGHVSLLAKYGYTEQMAFDLCKQHGLLSPLYDLGTRGGCWFCPNARIAQLAKLKRMHPDLWAELETLSHTPNLCSYGFKYGETVQKISRKLDALNSSFNHPTLFPDYEL